LRPAGTAPDDRLPPDDRNHGIDNWLLDRLFGR
jgi:hypothetical protein